MSAGMHSYSGIFLDKVVCSLMLYFVLMVFSGIWECVRGSTHQLSGEAINMSLTSSETFSPSIPQSTEHMQRSTVWRPKLGGGGEVGGGWVWATYKL